MLLAATADAVKVADAIDVELAEWQNPNLLHTTGHTMTALALALALGGDDANDVDLLDPLVATGLIDQVPSDSTVHRRHAELAGLGSDGTTAILAGMKSARRAAWAACGTRNPAARATTDNPLVIDLDATEILSHSDKEHATPTWKKHFGFHPLAAIIDHGDGLTGEPAAVLLRPGNAGSNTAADHITVPDQAVSALPEHADGHEWDTRLLVRTDAAGGSQSFLNHLNDQGLAYSIGFPVTWQIGEIASTLGTPSSRASSAPTAPSPTRVTATLPISPPGCGPGPGNPWAPTWTTTPTICGSSSGWNTPRPGRSCASPMSMAAGSRPLSPTAPAMPTGSTSCTAAGAGASNGSGT